MSEQGPIHIKWNTSAQTTYLNPQDSQTYRGKQLQMSPTQNSKLQFSQSY